MGMIIMIRSKGTGGWDVTLIMNIEIGIFTNVQLPYNEIINCADNAWQWYAIE